MEKKLNKRNWEKSSIYIRLDYQPLFRKWARAPPGPAKKSLQILTYLHDISMKGP